MRAFVASDDPALSYQVREQLLRLGHDCPSHQVMSLDAALARLAAISNSTRDAPSSRTGHPASAEVPKTSEPNLVLVVMSPAPERSLTLLRDIQRCAAKPRLFAVGPTTDSKLVLRVLREGADEYLDQAELPEELATALERLKAEESGRAPARTIAILPASGGSGSSTLAVNIGMVLARQAGGCVLLDLKPEMGDLAALLDLKPEHSLADVCRHASRLDRSLLENSLVRHESGLLLLAAPARIEDAAHVTSEAVHQVLSLAIEFAPYVVADLNHCCREETIQTLLHADHALLVLRLDFTSLRNARRALDYVEGNGIARERMQMVVNRYGQPGEISISEAETALGTKIYKSICDDPKSVNRANNQGVPVTQQYPSAKVSRQITELALRLHQQHPHR